MCIFLINPTGLLKYKKIMFFTNMKNETVQRYNYCIIFSYQILTMIKEEKE